MSPKTLLPIALLALLPPVVLAARQVPPPAPPPPATPAAAGQGLARDPSQGRGRSIPLGTGVVSGMVVAADTGRPLSRARVNLSGTVTSTDSGAGGAGAIAGAGGRGGAVGGIQVINGVQVSGGMGFGRTVVTDSQGQFSFPKVPAGQYTVSVSREQFLPTSYGQKKPNRPGTVFALTEGQKLSIKIPMLRGGVITGQVVGEDGDPLTNAQVRAMRYDMSSGFKRLLQTGFASTDDRGVYRIFGMQPGEYIVAATQNASDIERAMADATMVESMVAAANGQPTSTGQPPMIVVPLPNANGDNGPPAGFAPTYYPSVTTIANALNVTVNAGEEHANVDISVQTLRAANVTGSVVGAPPQGAGAVQISLQPNDPALAGALSLPGARANPDGKFVLRNIPPGQYTLIAYTMPSPVQQAQFVNGAAVPAVAALAANVNANGNANQQQFERLWGRALLTVDGQTSPEVVVTLQAGKAISGRVMFDTQAMPPDLNKTRVTVTLSPAPSAQQVPTGPIPSAQVTPDGRFSLESVPPGRYIIRAGVQGGPNSSPLQNPIVVKSSMANGQDTLDIPLEFTSEQDVSNVTITMTDKLTELSGTLSEASGKPANDYTILVVSSDNRFWQPGSRRILTSRAGPDGHYQFRNIPPGDYLIAAVTDFDSGTQYDPEFLKAFAAASMRISLTEGTKKTQDLRVAAR